ncbi:hypothetical protein [Streptomyces niveus]|uniref:hypothetical protein n=1 Tax=Streptomyces niveus TaxID=193462 RepID=UPI0036D29907
MTRARTLLILLYGLVYLAAVIAATDAQADGHTAPAVALLASSVGLLIAIRREYRHVIDLIRTTGHAPVVDHQAAIPTGCCCETWWNSLGDRHDCRCPAHTWKETS